jgi:hypothetical protein
MNLFIILARSYEFSSEMKTGNKKIPLNKKIGPGGVG